MRPKCQFASTSFTYICYFITIIEHDYRIDSKVRCEGAHPLCSALSQRGLNPIKLAHDPRRPDGGRINAVRTCRAEIK